jgi:hypothetical protein
MESDKIKYLENKINYLENKLIECQSSLNMYSELIKKILQLPLSKEELKKYILDIIIDRESYYFNQNKQKIPNELKELIQSGIVITGPPGKEGSIGKEGPSGKPGPMGLPGPQGEKGQPGEKGKDGRDGINGFDVINGINGEKGPDGEQGPIGPRGKKGPDGELQINNIELEKIIDTMLEKKYIQQQY